MKKFLNKQKGKDEEDANCEQLFGGRSSSPAKPRIVNPYAEQAPPPYQSYQPSSQSSNTSLPRPRMSRQPSDRSMDSSREELFRGAATAGNGKSNMQGGYRGFGGEGNGGYANASSSNSYPQNYDPAASGYGEQAQEQAEVDEDEEVESVKQQLRYTKQESVSSSRNALRMANDAEDSGRATLERLGTQSDRFAQTGRNLDLAQHYNRTASDRARELRTLNRSMFAVHVSNPFTKGKRTAKEEERIQDRYALEQMEREETRMAGQASQRRVNTALNNHMRSNRFAEPRKGASMVERSKYQFEADEEDDLMEKEIDSNLGQLGDAAGRLKNLAVATNEELETQNRQLDKIVVKGDRVGAGINLNTERLKRIH